MRKTLPDVIAPYEAYHDYEECEEPEDVLRCEADIVRRGENDVCLWRLSKNGTCYNAHNHTARS